MFVLDLFSGIGGFSLGLERAGMRTVAFCEADVKCQLVLKKHWPEVPIYDDIKTLTAERLKRDGIGPVDVVCGGFPCQPFSVAGKRRGKEDDRHLWPEMLRLITEIQPSWVLAENVANFANMGLEDASSDLESEGYEVQSFIIPACAVGAPHRRDRVWMVANHNSKLGEELFGWEEVEDEITEALFGRGDEVCRGQWEAEPRVGRVAHGVPNRVDRLKQLGNTVVPRIPEIFGEIIMKVAK